MNETLNQEITDKIQDNQKASMRFCPYCKSNRIESMGFRDSTNTVRRFRCKNPECLKSHSRDANTGELTTEKEPEKAENTEILLKGQRANKTLNVTETTKERLRGIKLYERETDDDIIKRLLDEHFGKIKK